MPEKNAAFEPAVAHILDAIDPASSVSVSVQLRGAFEFGIASGELPAGQRLPSVRTLARRLSISPVTAANVYAALQAAGHIEGRAGSGTYVSRAARSHMRSTLLEVDARIADLIALGRECGLSASELSLRVGMAGTARRHAVRLLIVSNFQEATEDYAADIRPHLAEGDRIVAMTLTAFEAGHPTGHDLILAPHTLLPRLRELAPETEAVGITFLPAKATRVALAALPPEARIVGYSYFPGFVTIMKTGIQRYAPHVPDLRMVVRGDSDEAALLSAAEVVIYATGADYLKATLSPHQNAFEYRHTPDARSIRADILPAIEACRRRLTTEREAAE
ncbi:MAG: GntR family transcriptional regulator [Tropicimonas sp.]|uniref:GntR family transcriptional regulator n=1 Tax=Tropicimonas sp. TaxID=2067044 RepID=UPI003A89B7EC